MYNKDNSRNKKSCYSHSNTYHNEYYDGKRPYSGQIKRGDVFFFDKCQSVGTEMHGGRPGIIVSADTGRYQGDNVLVVYTTTAPKSDMPTHVKINSMSRESTALCEQIHTLSTKKIEKYCGHITDEEMKELDKALAASIGISASEYLTKETIVTDNELINKLAIERDTYKEMYQELLNKIMKQGRK